MRRPLVSIAVISILLFSCAPSEPFIRRSVSDTSSIKGHFTLHLLRNEGGHLAARGAVLDREGDAIVIVPAVSGYDLRTSTGLTLPEAVEASRLAFATHCAYTGHLLRALTTPSGELAGLEIVPTYTPFICESAPSVYLNYFKKGGGMFSVTFNVMGRVSDDSLPGHGTGFPPK